MQPLVSVIIPIYNSENYLKACIESIMHQTYLNLEIICVIDGATDASASICKDYANQDTRIIVLEKENEGPALGRKYGLCHAHGQYVMTVDSDDWIELDTIEDCVSSMLQYHAECVAFGYTREYLNKSIPTLLWNQGNVFRGADVKCIHRRLIGPIGDELKRPERLESFSSVCMKLYDIALFKKGKFVSEREVGSSEDTLFNIYALESCDCLVYLNKCYYHYRKTNVSSITSRYRSKLAEQWDILYQYFQEYLNSGAEEIYKKAFLNRVCCGMIGLGFNEISSPKGIVSQAKSLRTILNKTLYQNAFRQLDTTGIPVHWKLFFRLCKWKMSVVLALLLKVMDRLRSHVS